MDTTLNLIFRYTLLLSTLRRGKVRYVLGERVQRVFMREDFLVGDAQVALSWVQTIGDKQRDTFGAHHICFLWVPRTCNLRSFQPVAWKSQEGSGQL